jgi:hypothetical protein
MLQNIKTALQTIKAFRAKHYKFATKLHIDYSHLTFILKKTMNQNLSK